jgi:hypothetical protein
MYYDPIKEAGEYSYYSVAVYKKLGKIIESEPSESLSLTIDSQLSSPKFSHQSGTYDEPILLVILSEEESTDVFYTINGDEPDFNSFLYQEPILIGESTTFKAKNYKIGCIPSDVAFVEYIITQTNISDELLPSVAGLKLYPNPILLRNEESRVNYALNIEYYLPKDTNITTISIYNVRGQLIEEYKYLTKARGRHQISWNLTDHSDQLVTSGVYFVKVAMDNEICLKKVMIIK